MLGLKLICACKRGPWCHANAVVLTMWDTHVLVLREKELQLPAQFLFWEIIEILLRVPYNQFRTTRVNILQGFEAGLQSFALSVECRHPQMSVCEHLWRNQCYTDIISVAVIGRLLTEKMKPSTAHWCHHQRQHQPLWNKWRHIW